MVEVRQNYGDKLNVSKGARASVIVETVPEKKMMIIKTSPSTKMTKKDLASCLNKMMRVEKTSIVNSSLLMTL